jgi:hypothetical protein
MSVYIIVILIVFVLIAKKLFPVLAEKNNETTPPIFDQNQGKDVFYDTFKEIFNEDKKSKNKKSEVIFSEKKQSNLKNQGSIVTEAKNTELKNEIIEENFDIRKAIIYSEIINNPFISKNKIYEN